MELFRLIGSIAIDNTNANRAINETTEEANDAKDEVSDAFNKIGGTAVTIAKGIGVAGVAIGGAFIATIESTREYRQEMGKLDTAFVTNGHSSKAAKQTYSELNAVLGETDQAVEASNHLALLTDNEEDLQKWTNICTGVYATFGASLPIEGLTEAANETAKVGQVTGPLADALNWAGISEDEFNKKLEACSNEQERQKLIMETLNSTYSDASVQYQETNKDILESRKAQERLSDAMAAVGAVGEPVMTLIKNSIADMAEKVVPILETLIKKIQEGIVWVKENESTIHTWVAVILGATVAIGTFLVILNWGAIMTAAANAINVVRTAILAMNAALLANPIGLIVALIAGLVVAFVYLWNNVEGFRKFWIDAWKNITKATKDAMEKVKQFFSDAWSKITSVFGSVGSWFGEKFKGAWTSIKNAFSGFASFFSDLWNRVKNGFGNIGAKIGQAMSGSVKSAMNTVIGLIEGAINKGISLINSAIDLANKLPAVNVGKVSRVNLPRMAEGGVLEKGQIGILEGTGTEAVVPLEKNTEWIDKVAARFEVHSDSGAIKELTERVDSIIDLIQALMGRNIYLDSGALVGELAPAMNDELGIYYNLAKRYNTR